MYRYILVVALATALSGCATVFEGLHQNISVATSPGNATCDFERQGQSIGTISSTPGTLIVRKDKHDILIKCTKPGYVEAEFLNHSGTTATIAANVAADLLLTWGVSSVVDSADGADNKYESAVNIILMPLPAPTPATSATATPPASSATSQAGNRQAPSLPVSSTNKPGS